MLVNLFLFVAQLNAPDIVLSAMESFRAIDSYSVTINSKNMMDEGEEEVIRYYYKKPGYVRMEFINPHKGAVLVYNPKEGKARLRPFGFFKQLVLVLRPDNRLIRSYAGYTVDRSDIGILLESVRELQQNGTAVVTGTERVGDRETFLLRVEGKEDYSVEATETNMYLLNLDKETVLPLRVRTYNLYKKMTQDVLMEDLEVNPALPEGIFDIE